MTDTPSDFLRDFLQAGPVSADAVKTKATEAGITAKQLWNAKRVLGVVSVKQKGFATGWKWYLPNQAPAVEPDHGLSPAHAKAQRHRDEAVRHRDVEPLEPAPAPPRGAVARMWDQGVEVVKKVTTPKPKSTAVDPNRLLDIKLLENVLAAFT